MDEQQPLNQILSRAVQEKPVGEGLRQRVEIRLRKVEQQQRWRNWSVKLALAASLSLLVWSLVIPRQATQLTLDLVGHHETCWVVPSSEPRSQQFQTWVEKHPGTPLIKADKMGKSLQLFDRRGCPVLGAARSPHWMFRDPKGGMVSLYLFNHSDLTTSKGPPSIQADLYGNCHVLTWADGDCMWAMVAQAPVEQMQQWIGQSTLTGFDPRQLGRILAAAP